MAKKKPTTAKDVQALTHTEATRKNNPTIEYQAVMTPEQAAPRAVVYPRAAGGLEGEKAERNPDLDPQLVWRGKDRAGAADLVAMAPPIYTQEKVSPKALIEDLRRHTAQGREEKGHETADLFANFNGIPEGADRTDFYQHDQHWQNRMILGDSLQVMASLAEREGLRGKVQCIYLDPPYGIKFESNFQWSTTSPEVTDGKAEHITREPEQVKAFRDTWRDGIHSYLSYLRDRLIVARDLLHESGSIFVQIGDENVHRVRALMDEVFGDKNCVAEILVKKKGSQKGGTLDAVNDYILWYGKSAKTSGRIKIRPVYEHRDDADVFEDFPFVELGNGDWYRVSDLEAQDERPYRKDMAEFRARYPDAKLFAANPLKSGGYRRQQSLDFSYRGKVHPIKLNQCWKHTVVQDDGSTPGMLRLGMANRLFPQNTDIRFVRHSPMPSIREISNWWDGFGGAPNQVYVVQTNTRVIERILLMASDPGDLVLDPTCGSGTTAYVAEQWGRRWITIDTSRVALALARARLMGARYPYYLLKDSREGQMKEAEITKSAPSTQPTYGNITHGFVCERVRNVTSGSIANNAEIDIIWQKWEDELRPLREKLTAALPAGWLAQYRKAQKYTADVPPEIQEWEVPREAGEMWSSANQDLFFKLRAEQEAGNADKAATLLSALNHNLNRRYTLETLPEKPLDPWSQEATRLHAEFWEKRIARQREIDASIARKADVEYLYDKPYEDRKTVRVAGPFTVESLSPHRMLTVDEDGNPVQQVSDGAAAYDERPSFAQLMLEELRASGVQQAHKEDRITFTSLEGWPGRMVCAEGRYMEGDQERRAGILIGPEFGTVQRADLVEAARECGDAGFDALIACAFSYEAMATEFRKFGRVPVLQARMNADLHMSGDLASTGKGNLFVIFGEPDIEVLDAPDGRLRVKVNGVDVFKPQTGEVVSDNTDGIACWFVDTSYNEESFFVRQAYFLGAADPYGALKTSLKAEINEDAWSTLHSNTSRPFDKPETGRIAVKVINHLGDEVMKVFRV